MLLADLAGPAVVLVAVASGVVALLVLLISLRIVGRSCPPFLLLLLVGLAFGGSALEMVVARVAEVAWGHLEQVVAAL